jgi:hypothetical protein
MRMRDFVLIIFIIPLSLLFFSCQKKIDSPSTPPKPSENDLQESVKKDLWAYYSFSNGSFSDQSGNNHSITPSSSLKATYDMVGNPDEAIEFDGADDYAIIDDGKNFPEGDFSVSFTIMPTSTNGTIFQKADYTSNKGYSFSIGFNDIDNDSRLLFSTNNTSDPCSSTFNINPETTAYGARTLFTNAWYYVCIIFQNGEEHIYINTYEEGNLKTSVQTLKHCNSAPFYIGSPSSGGIPGFVGKMDNLRIYTRALTPDEVNYLYWAFK